MSKQYILVEEDSYTDPVDFIDVVPMTADEIAEMDAQEAAKKSETASYDKLPLGVAQIMKAFNAASTTDTDRAIFIQKLVKNDSAFNLIKEIAKELGKTL